MKNICSSVKIQTDTNFDGVFSYLDIPGLIINLYKWVESILTPVLADTAIGNFFEIRSNSCESFSINVVSGLLIFTGLLVIILGIQRLSLAIKKYLYSKYFSNNFPVPMWGLRRIAYRWCISRSGLIISPRLLLIGVIIVGGYTYISSSKNVIVNKKQPVVQLKNNKSSDSIELHQKDPFPSVEGDASKFQYVNIYLENKSSLSSLNSRVRSITSEQANSFKSLSSALTEGLSSDLEKTYVIYKWVTENIAYDTDAFFSNNLRGAADPINVLRTRKGICDGYSQLMVNLGRQAGLKISKVNGYSKGYGYSPGTPIKGSNHSWNIVQINGKPFRWSLDERDPLFRLPIFQSNE